MNVMFLCTWPCWQRSALTGEPSSLSAFTRSHEGVKWSHNFCDFLAIGDNNYKKLQSNSTFWGDGLCWIEVIFHGMGDTTTVDSAHEFFARLIVMWKLRASNSRSRKFKFDVGSICIDVTNHLATPLRALPMNFLLPLILLYNNKINPSRVLTKHRRG